MSVVDWSERNEMANALEEALTTQTHGLIRELSVRTCEDSVVARGTARSFYGVQLAIHAMQQIAEQCGSNIPTTLMLTIDGATLEFTSPQDECVRNRRKKSKSRASTAVGAHQY